MPGSLDGRSPFTLVVVNYNGGAMLIECVESVMAAGLAADRIVLVDNGSRDGSADAVAQRCPDAKIIRNGCNAGFARAANQGLAEASTEYGVILNSDALLSPDTLSALAQAFATDRSLAIAGGRLVYPDGSAQHSVAPFPRVASELLPKPLRRWAGGRFALPAPHGPELRYVESTVGALFAVRMSHFRALGGFDEDYFFFMEETDLCKRASDKGLRVAQATTAVVTHRQGATAKRYAGAARIEFQRAKLTYFRKHLPRALYGVMRIMLPVKAVVNALGSLLACVVTLFLSGDARRKARQAGAVLAWYLLLCPSSWGLPDKCPRNP